MAHRSQNQSNNLPPSAGLDPKHLIKLADINRSFIAQKATLKRLPFRALFLAGYFPVLKDKVTILCLLVKRQEKSVSLRSELVHGSV
jgi:hypothetical protein